MRRYPPPPAAAAASLPCTAKTVAPPHPHYASAPPAAAGYYPTVKAISGSSQFFPIGPIKKSFGDIKVRHALLRCAVLCCAVLCCVVKCPLNAFLRCPPQLRLLLVYPLQLTICPFSACSAQAATPSQLPTLRSRCAAGAASPETWQLEGHTAYCPPGGRRWWLSAPARSRILQPALSCGWLTHRHPLVLCTPTHPLQIARNIIDAYFVQKVAPTLKTGNAVRCRRRRCC